MPFKSKAQRRWMHANHPDMAARWEDETEGKLPSRVKRKKTPTRRALEAARRRKR